MIRCERRSPTKSPSALDQRLEFEPRRKTSAATLRRSPLIDPKQLAAAVAVLADRKKGVDIRVYDVAEHIKVADYFVLVSGLSRPHVRAIYDEIHAGLKSLGERHSRVEGADLGWWVLLDYMDVVVHVLQPEAREYYQLDGLYAECPLLDYARVPLPDLASEPPARAAGA